jgi:arylsulfatase A-like enzyme
MPCHRSIRSSLLKVSLILTGMVLMLVACYPISVTRTKWHIKWDKDLMRGKEAWLNEPLAERSGGRPPNIVVLVCDDLGKYEVSAYGAEHVQTPNIDRLAASGVLFDEGYVTAPTCAPSRAGIMTGRVQNRFGFESQMMEFYPTNMIEYLSGKYIVNTEDWVLASKPQYPSEWQVHRQGVPPTEINLAEALGKYGYHTGLVGKWHLGISRHHLPLERGFDYQYGFHGAFSLYAPEQHWNKVVNYVGESFSTRYQWESGRYGDGAITRMGKEIREEQYLTFAIRDEAIGYIERQQQEPFFLYCAFSAPHVPFQAPVDYYCRYAHVEEENKQVYYAMISALDDAIGAIHQRIIDLGLEEQTVIYLLSDNGGATYTGATDNGPLKGGKLMQFEGGLNVPFMVSWPGHIPAGQRFADPVSSTDIFATSLALAGGTLPEDRPYDGVNLMPYILGENAEAAPHEQLFWRCDHIWAVRDGDYKLILSTRDGWAELYDLKTDKSESINLAEDMPDLLAKLRDMHQQWQSNELPEKPMWPRIMDHRFVIDGQTYLFPA